MSKVLETVALSTFVPAPNDGHWVRDARRVLASAAKRSTRERVVRLERELLRIAQATDNAAGAVKQLIRENEFNSEQAFAMTCERDTLERIISAYFAHGCCSSTPEG
ncbi:MAG: hypothetical protein FWD73_07005 [Polyangiaceae bacterium]|nr:hypothetical protein [Polyangiaceae bacterium]